MDVWQLVQKIAAILNEKKAKDVEIIDVRDKTTLADYFVIASGGSTTQVKALVDEVDDQLEKQAGLVPNHIEGNQKDRWVLMDYRDVIVHIFLDEERAIYNIEKLWNARWSGSSPEENKG